MSTLSRIRRDIEDELHIHTSYFGVKQPRDDPRVIVEMSGFMLDNKDDVEEQIEEIVERYTDLDVEVQRR